MWSPASVAVGGRINAVTSGICHRAAISRAWAPTNSTVAWIRLWTRQPYPLHFSCNALELGPAKFCRPVKNTDANLRFSLLIFKMSCFEFGPGTAFHRPIWVSARLRLL